MRNFNRTRQVLLGVGVLGLLAVAGSVLQKDDSSALARMPKWSEQLGAGEVFPACGSSFAISCTTSANACGQTDFGFLKLDGSCSVTTPPDSACPVPSVTMYMSPTGDTTIDTGQSATLFWESPDAVSCRWAGGFSESTVGPSGSISTGPLTDSSAYQICCAYASGVCSPAAQVVITVLHPFVAISASPVRVRVNGSSTITWETRDVGNCVVTKNGAPYLSPSGASDVITTQTTYTVSCETNGDPLVKSARVNVVPIFEEF